MEEIYFIFLAFDFFFRVPLNSGWRTTFVRVPQVEKPCCKALYDIQAHRTEGNTIERSEFILGCIRNTEVAGFIIMKYEREKLLGFAM